MLGNLLGRAWIPAVSGGMTMTSARLNVMAQYIVHPSFPAPAIFFGLQLSQVVVGLQEEVLRLSQTLAC